MLNKSFGKVYRLGRLLSKSVPAESLHLHSHSRTPGGFIEQRNPMSSAPGASAIEGDLIGYSSCFYLRSLATVKSLRDRSVVMYFLSHFESPFLPIFLVPAYALFSFLYILQPLSRISVGIEKIWPRIGKGRYLIHTTVIHYLQPDVCCISPTVVQQSYHSMYMKCGFFLSVKS